MKYGELDDVARVSADAAAVAKVAQLYADGEWHDDGSEAAHEWIKQTDPDFDQSGNLL